RVEPSPGSPPVDSPKLARTRVGLALALAESGPPRASMLESLERFGPGHPVRADVHAAGPRHLLYVRRMLELPPGALAAPTGAAPGASSAVPAAAPNTRLMSAELHTLRRDLTRLQREVAELRAMAQELEQRRR